MGKSCGVEQQVLIVPSFIRKWRTWSHTMSRWCEFKISLSDSKDEKILLRSSVVYQKCALGVGFGGVVRQLVRGICNSMPI